jgi:hypothetical protein
MVEQRLSRKIYPQFNLAAIAISLILPSLFPETEGYFLTNVLSINISLIPT